MDSKKLEILMAAVNLGSFSKASEVVGLATAPNRYSPSSVSPSAVMRTL